MVFPSAGEVIINATSVTVTEGSGAMVCVVLTATTNSTTMLANAVAVDLRPVLRK